MAKAAESNDTHGFYYGDRGDECFYEALNIMVLKELELELRRYSRESPSVSFAPTLVTMAARLGRPRLGASI